VLFEALLGPLAHELGAASRLIVAPDGLLHYLPFDALLVEGVAAAPPRGGFATLPFLVRRTVVMYAPSASALAALRVPGGGQRAGADRRELLLVGDPGPAGAPGAGDELRWLGRRFPREATVALTGRDATCRRLADTLRSLTFRYIHIAAHGRFNGDRPLLSGLVLADDAGASEAVLTAHDVLALPLDCDLVMLSACSSALGERTSGEGISGLTRAFMHAGARNVAATLWDVSGPKAAALADLFYAELQRDAARGPARALAAATRRALDTPSLSHPSVWASVVLTGCDRPAL
jgi:CHAT domain-containing protein